MEKDQEENLQDVLKILEGNEGKYPNISNALKLALEYYRHSAETESALGKMTGINSVAIEYILQNQERPASALSAATAAESEGSMQDRRGYDSDSEFDIDSDSQDLERGSNQSKEAEYSGTPKQAASIATAPTSEPRKIFVLSAQSTDEQQNQDANSNKASPTPELSFAAADVEDVELLAEEIMPSTPPIATGPTREPRKIFVQSTAEQQNQDANSNKASPTPEPNIANLAQRPQTLFGRIASYFSRGWTRIKGVVGGGNRVAPENSVISNAQELADGALPSAPEKVGPILGATLEEETRDSEDPSPSLQKPVMTQVHQESSRLGTPKR